VKGLLYKEWCLGKKFFWRFLLLAVLFSVLGILISLSLQFGNLKGESDAVGARYLTGALLFGFSFVYNLVYSVILGSVSTIS
jgi:hypothetical protein